MSTRMSVMQLSARPLPEIMLLLLGAAAAAAAAPASPIQCAAASLRPQWPTYHFFNNITRGPRCYCSPAPCHCGGGGAAHSQELVMEPLNDANAVFEYKGLFHVMMQAGGGNWTHGVSTTAAGPWFMMQDALGRSPKSSLPWDSHQGPCDGSLSFPDLGKAPYDGSAPVILYGPDCNVPVKPGGAGGKNGSQQQQQKLDLTGSLRAEADSLKSGLGDAPRVEVALPNDPADPLLRDWHKVMPGPVTFDGTPCSFPGHVWKSPGSDTWNMVCALDGKAPWARFTSNTPTLMRWKLADKCFTFSAETGLPQPMDAPGGATPVKSGAYFQAVPNPKAGGPTHMINAGACVRGELLTY